MQLLAKYLKSLTTKPPSFCFWAKWALENVRTTLDRFQWLIFFSLPLFKFSLPIPSLSWPSRPGYVRKKKESWGWWQMQLLANYLKLEKSLKTNLVDFFFSKMSSSPIISDKTLVLGQVLMIHLSLYHFPSFLYQFGNFQSFSTNRPGDLPIVSDQNAVCWYIDSSHSTAWSTGAQKSFSTYSIMCLASIWKQDITVELLGLLTHFLFSR